MSCSPRQYDPRPDQPSYRRLETDPEFRERVLKWLGSKAKWWASDLNYAHKEALDEIVWSAFKKQRKLVEVFP